MGCPVLLFFIAFRLYLNPESFQFRPGLRGVLVMNHIHPQSSGVLEVQRAVINEYALLRRPLRHLQRYPEDLLLRLPRMQIAGAKKDLKVLAQPKRLNPIVVQFPWLIINGCYKIFFDTCYFPKQFACLRILLRLGKHEGRKFFPCESTRPVKKRPVEILVEGNLPGIEGGKREVVPVPELWSHPFVRTTPPMSQKTVVMVAKEAPPGKPLRDIRRRTWMKVKKAAQGLRHFKAQFTPFFRLCTAPRNSVCSNLQQLTA